MYCLVLTFLPLDLFVGSMSCLLKECCPENQGARVILNGDFLWTCTSLVVQLVKNLSAMQETPVRFLEQEDPHWRRDGLPTPVFLGFLCGSAGKESACNAEDLGLIPGLRRSPGEWKGYQLQCSGLENSMDSIVLIVAKC